MLKIVRLWWTLVCLGFWQLPEASKTISDAYSVGEHGYKAIWAKGVRFARKADS